MNELQYTTFSKSVEFFYCSISKSIKNVHADLSSSLQDQAKRKSANYIMLGMVNIHHGLVCQLIFVQLL